MAEEIRCIAVRHDLVSTLMPSKGNRPTIDFDTGAQCRSVSFAYRGRLELISHISPGNQAKVKEIFQKNLRTANECLMEPLRYFEATYRLEE